MASATRRRGIIAEINVTPLVDIMLVLLIIFMLTAHLIARQAIEIELPRVVSLQCFGATARMRRKVVWMSLSVPSASVTASVFDVG